MFSVLQDVLEGIHMALVHVHVRICRKFQGLLFSSTPLIESGIQLIDRVSAVHRKKQYHMTHHSRNQRNHGNRNLLIHNSIVTLICGEKMFELICEGG